MREVQGEPAYPGRTGLLYEFEHLELIATMISSSVLAFVNWPVVTHRGLFIWYGLILSVTLSRAFLRGLSMRSSVPRSRSRARPFNAGVFMSGVCWGAGIIFLSPEAPASHQLFTVLVLAGMIAVAAGVYSSEMRTFAAFAFPCSIPMFKAAVLVPEYFYLGMGAVLFYMLAVTATAFRLNVLAVNSMNTEVEHCGPIDDQAGGEGLPTGEAETPGREIPHTAVGGQSLGDNWERYRGLFEYSNDCIILIEPNGRVIDANRKVSEEFGFTRSEITAKNILELQPPWVADKIGKSLEDIRQNGSGCFEFPFLRRNGDFFDAEVSVSRYEAGGEPLIQMSIRNVTERNLREKEVRQTKEQLEDIIDNAVEGIGIVNREGNFVFWNKRARDIFGYATEEIQGRHFSMLYSDPDAMQNVQRVLRREGVVRQREVIMKKKNHQEVPMEISINIFRNDAGKVLGSFCVARDLSEKKRLEAQLLQAQKMEAVGTLAGGIAHDFNNLLHAIQGYAELLLLNVKESQTGHRELREISRAAIRGGYLTKRLLTFSRKLDAELRPVNLNILVTQSARLLERTIPKMVSIDLDLQEDLSQISADPTQIEQILINLAVNAKDAMPNGGRLIIETSDKALNHEFCRVRPNLEPGVYVLMSMADTGQGMDRQTINCIFDPFFTTKGVGKGTGLGLSIVYSIVTNHRGFIECTSEPGAGTRFDIYFPALQSYAEEDEAGTLQPPRGNRELVLVVDDEDTIREVSTEILTTFGYSVLTASDGETALDIYQKEMGQIEIVILDLIMPGMGGSQCLEKLIKLDPKAKVIIASGYHAEEQQVDPIALGAKRYIRKPFQINELLTCVRDVLDR